MSPPIPEPVSRLTWKQVSAWRLRQQNLDRRAPRDEMLRVASELCGLHAQVMSSAELTLWTRLDGLERDAVSRALWEDRSLVKLWAMRGTLHLLTSAHYPMWQAALSAHEPHARPAWLRAFGVTMEEMEAIQEAIDESLRGQVLAREELGAAVAARTGKDELGGKVLHSWGVMLKPACRRGRLCFAPGEGQKVRFTHPDTWLGERSSVEPSAALREVARRFLGVYGPADREDLSRWWGMSPAEGGRVLRELGDEIVPVDIEGMAAWALRRSPPEIESSTPARTVNLIPGFDQYVIGATRQAEQLMPAGMKARIYRDQGWISPVLLVNGRMEGVWRYDRKGSRLLVSIEPFTTQPKWVRKGAEADTERLGAFLDGRIEFLWREPA